MNIDYNELMLYINKCYFYDPITIDHVKVYMEQLNPSPTFTFYDNRNVNVITIPWLCITV